MQAKQGTLRTVVVVLIASLVLTACSGSNGQGSTWFNLPSIPVTLDAQGNASVLGFNLGYIGLQPSLIAQLQAANVQQLEVRIGHNGIFLYQNGQALPYIAWDDESVDTLLTVLRSGALDRLQSLLRAVDHRNGHSMDADLVRLLAAQRIRFEEAFQFAFDKSTVLAHVESGRRSAAPGVEPTQEFTP